MGVADFPASLFPLGAVAFLILLDALAIAVSEEVTFRFSVHRLLWQCGPAIYIGLSSALFGLLHFPAGVEAILVTGLIGASWAAARVAGMPIVLLVVVYAISSISSVPVP